VKFEDRYPWDDNSYILQVVEGLVFRAVYSGEPCTHCGSPCDYITYKFLKQALPVCSHECHEALEELANSIR
jgi:hypothetical protein